MLATQHAVGIKNDRPLRAAPRRKVDGAILLVPDGEDHRVKTMCIGQIAMQRHIDLCIDERIGDGDRCLFVGEHARQRERRRMTGIADVLAVACTEDENTLAGETVRKHFLEQSDGRGIRWFRLQLDGWYAFVLPHIDVAYDAQNHDLFEYRGLSNIRGSGNRNLTVTIQFPPAEHRADTGVPDVERAAAMPLTGRCAS